MLVSRALKRMLQEAPMDLLLTCQGDGFMQQLCITHIKLLPQYHFIRHQQEEGHLTTHSVMSDHGAGPVAGSSLPHQDFQTA